MTTFVMPDGEDALIRRIQQLERDMRELRAQNPLATAGIQVGPDSVSFTGAVAIAGTLSLPAGIIDNDALANPVIPDSTWGTGSGFSVPEAWTEQATCSVVVPAGFTRVQFTAIATIKARNDTGATQYLSARVRRQVNGTGTAFSSVAAQDTLPNLYWATSMAPYVVGDVVVPGDTHRFWVESWGGVGFSAHVDHQARIEVAWLFTR